MENYIDDSRIHEGHRERMRSKLLKHGQHIFDTYELLEMLLYQVIPYKDTNPIAKRLLARFGSLEGVLSASAEELTEVSGIGGRASEFISSVGILGDVIGAELLSEDSRSFTSYDAVGKYLTAYFSKVDGKQVVAMFLDGSMRLISMKKLYDLEYESGGVKAKPFIDEAAKNRATVVITAHNHPYGPFYPTPGDRATNSVITEALNMAGFLHAEHYIISGDKYAGIGSLNNFTSQLSQTLAVSEFLADRARHDGSVVCVSSLTKDDCAALTCSYNSGYNKRDLDYFALLLRYCIGDGAEKAAASLLHRYYTIENSMCASVGELTALAGEKCAFYLKLLAYVTSRRTTDKFDFGRKYSRAQIADYLKALFLGDSVEKTYLITFSSDERMTGCELLGEGTVCSSELTPRKAVEVAVASSASAVAIAHNHPAGTTRPSADDVNLTKLFANIFASCEIALADHYIVAGQLCDTIKFEM